MSREAREVVGDWLMVAGAILLGISLFLPWSHQLSARFAAAFAGTGALAGVPRDPTAWQVFSLADVLLALLAGGIFGLAMIGPRRPRIAALIACAVALAFVAHALAVPPTRGVNLVAPAAGSAAPPVDHPGSGAGETVALAAVILSAAGLGLSLSAD